MTKMNNHLEKRESKSSRLFFICSNLLLFFIFFELRSTNWKSTWKKRWRVSLRTKIRD